MKEERFLSLSLVSALLTLYFVKWQYDEIFFFPHLRAQRKNHLRDVFMSAEITCAMLHKSEFRAIPLSNQFAYVRYIFNSNSLQVIYFVFLKRFLH